MYLYLCSRAVDSLHKCGQYLHAWQWSTADHMFVPAMCVVECANSVASTSSCLVTVLQHGRACHAFDTAPCTCTWQLFLAVFVMLLTGLLNGFLCVWLLHFLDKNAHFATHMALLAVLMRCHHFLKWPHPARSTRSRSRRKTVNWHGMRCTLEVERVGSDTKAIWSCITVRVKMYK